MKCKSLSRVRLFAIPWTIQSMEFSKAEYWSGQPFPSPGDLPNPGIEPRSPTLQAILYQLSHKGHTVSTEQTNNKKTQQGNIIKISYFLKLQINNTRMEDICGDVPDIPSYRDVKPQYVTWLLQIRYKPSGSCRGGHFWIYKHNENSDRYDKSQSINVKVTKVGNFTVITDYL